MIYQPTIVRSEENFKIAIVSQKPIIILENESLFWKIETAEKKAMKAHNTMEAGGNLLMLGGTAAAGIAVASGLVFSVFLPPALLFGGIAAVVTGGGAKLAGGATVKAFQKHYEKYGCIFDYDSRFVFFLKLIGESKIEGNDRPWIDLKNAYPKMPEKIELRRPDGTLIKNRVENGILKLFVD